MLTSKRGAQKHESGFRAKISDYGMLRELEKRGFATPHCYPTLAHLAPEVLLKGSVSKVRTSAALLEGCQDSGVH